MSYYRYLLKQMINGMTNIATGVMLNVNVISMRIRIMFFVSKCVDRRISPKLVDVMKDVTRVISLFQS